MKEFSLLNLKLRGGFFEIFFLGVSVVSFSVSSLFWIDSCCYKLLSRENILGNLKEKILKRKYYGDC